MANKRVSFFTNCQLDSVTGCWNWTGYYSQRGYGMMRYGRRVERVHRISAHCYLGYDLDSGLCVLHRCDNPRCFNPKHLFIGTQADNVRDNSAKGRNFHKNKTHCPQGHPYSGRNLMVVPAGPGHLYEGRHCRECNLLRKRRRDARKRAERIFP